MLKEFKDKFFERIATQDTWTREQIQVVFLETFLEVADRFMFSDPAAEYMNSDGDVVLYAIGIERSPNDLDLLYGPTPILDDLLCITPAHTYNPIYIFRMQNDGPGVVSAVHKMYLWSNAEKGWEFIDEE